jgi:sec-independent protein translocase protein TatA
LEEGEKMFGFGVTELILILLIILVIFGAGKLPEIGAGLGKGIKNFKKATSGEDEIDVTPEKKEIEEGEEDKS